MERYDVVVAGLGAMGSAVLRHLAGRGLRVLGLDRFSPPHPHGSSHGESRIIREAYFEDPRYVPLVQRAYDLWRELETETGRSLLRRTGALMLGAPDSEVIVGTLRSVREHGLPHQRLDAGELRRFHPAFRPDDGTLGIYEERAGVLDAEECVRAHLEAAAAAGAACRRDEEVTAWSSTAAGVEVATRSGRYSAGSLVLTVGPWLPDLLPSLPLDVERQTTHWFTPRADSRAFQPDRFPVYLWETSPGTYFYGMPDPGAGVKAARHHGGQRGALDALDPEVRETDVLEVRSFLSERLPAADGELLRSTVCRYTNTPSGHFLIGRHPEQPRVRVVSPCSGHGFKFAPVIGEIVADQLTEGKTRFDLAPFEL